MADTERRATLRLDLKPGNSTEMARSMTSMMSQFDNARRQSDVAKDRISQGMTESGLRQVPHVLPANALPASKLQNFFNTIGKLGEDQPLGVRVGAGKFAGAGLVASQVGGSIGGPLGSLMSFGGKTMAEGAAGFAAAGPMGAAIALIPAAVEAIKKIVSLPFNVMAGGFNMLHAGMQHIGGDLGAGGAVLGGFSGLVKMIPLVGEAVGGMIDAFTGFLSLGVKFSALSSPGAQKRFDIAKEDTMAVIGRAFTPIVEGLTQFTRLIGDFLATILPGTAEMRTYLAPLKDIFAEIKTALQALAPLFRTVLVNGLKEVAITLDLLAGSIAPFVKLLSLLPGAGDALKSSAAASTRNISFTDAESGAHSVYQGIYRNAPGGEAAKNPQVQAVMHLAKISTSVDEIKSKLPGMGHFTNADKERVRNSMENPMGLAGQWKNLKEGASWIPRLGYTIDWWAASLGLSGQH